MLYYFLIYAYRTRLYLRNPPLMGNHESSLIYLYCARFNLPPVGLSRVWCLSAASRQVSSRLETLHLFKSAKKLSHGIRSRGFETWTKREAENDPPRMKFLSDISIAVRVLCQPCHFRTIY